MKKVPKEEMSFVKEEPKAKPAGRPVEFDNKTVENSKSAEEILTGSWKRTVEELVGEKFSAEYKYSE